ncbi:hypothetical protein V6V47_12320 [Micromonospora sp. CPCC 205539]|uniref:hypothetical protein n=1 Tax=Micromonospora sp. CPCC 205539 TaxID=3122408 RepID=UPI002FF43721
MVTVTRGGVTLSVVTVLAGPLLAATPVHAAPPTAAPAVPAHAAAVLAASEPSGPGSATFAPWPGALVLAAPQPGPPEGAPAPQPEPSSRPGPVVDVFVEVSPSTVRPGYLVGIRASCRDNSVGATVVSDAFGGVGVQPQGGVLTAAPMVRERTRPGNYRVKLECRDGETASTMLQVVKKIEPNPSKGPATGFGGSAGGVANKLLLPGGAALTLTGLILAVMALRRPRTARR